MSEKYYNTEAYMKQFTPEQWLEAMVKVYTDSLGVIHIPVEMLRTGFRLNSPDGWKQVAPFWMKQFETEGIKPLEEFKHD